MSGRPRVFVGMVTHDSQGYLAGQLDAILAQEGVDVHVHVVDDHSEDATFRILETYAAEHACIDIVYNDVAVGRERCLGELVYGSPADDYDFFAYLGADETWAPDRLLAGTEHISANTSRPELYYSGWRVLGAHGDVKVDSTRFAACALRPASLLLVSNWVPLGCMLMNGATIKMLRAHRTFVMPRGIATWVHAVVLYCGGYVYADLDRHLVDLCADGMRDADASEAGLAGACTQMAQALVRAYADDMSPETRVLVEAVATRGVSPKARRMLAARPDIVAPSARATSKLRLAILAGRF